MHASQHIMFTARSSHLSQVHVASHGYYVSAHMVYQVDFGQMQYHLQWLWVEDHEQEGTRSRSMPCLRKIADQSAAVQLL